jgi:soluble lytic murein transglycosylase-like protein
MHAVRLWLALSLSLAAAAQDPRAPMEASIARQLASVQVQRAMVHGAAPASVFCDPVPAGSIEPLVASAARREGLAPDLLRAVIAKESAGKNCAVSPKGAQGLMQLMPETAALLGVDNPFDPEQNIGGGARFLRYLLGRYEGNTALALAAYNAGPGRVDASGGVPRIPETMDYVSTILGQLKLPGSF